MQNRLTALFASLSTLAVLVCAPPAADAARAADGAAAGTAAGALVIVGGALRPDNAQVWQRIVALAGGAGARIAVFPTAAGNPERSGANVAATLNQYGARAFVVPVSARLKGTDVARAVDDPALADQVRHAGGAFFVGGDQARITTALRHADGSDSAVLSALWTMYRGGGVIAGTSAGAAIMSQTMFYEGRAPLPTLETGIVDGHDIAPGLGFVGPDLFVDQHFIVRGRFARMVPAMLARRYRYGLGVDENTAAVVTGGHAIEIIGYKGAILYDLAQATTDASRKGFNVSNARISYMDTGDRFDLRTDRFTPGPDKERVDPAEPEFHGPLFTSEVFGNSTVVDLLQRLSDSDQARAVGIAFSGAQNGPLPLEKADAPADKRTRGEAADDTPAGAAATASAARPAPPASAHGFEFTFTRVPGSEGYASNKTEAYSVYRIRMDVRPVRVTQPLYRID